LLAGTQALLESRKNVFARNGLDTLGVNVLDTTSDLVLPFLRKLESVEACGDGFEEIGAIPRRQLKGSLKDSV
jgi:hypothetical protein